MGAMSSVVVCGIMCSIIKCFVCLGAYLTENPHDNHDNYVRHSSTEFVLESTLQRSEQQLIIIIIIIIFINCSRGYNPVAVVILHVHKYGKKVTRKFKSGGLHERHVVATWTLGNHLSIRL
jgi:hypothetical protein